MIGSKLPPFKERNEMHTRASSKNGEWEIKPTLCDHKDATRGNLLETKIIEGKPRHTVNTHTDAHDDCQETFDKLTPQFDVSAALLAPK